MTTKCSIDDKLIFYQSLAESQGGRKRIGAFEVDGFCCCCFFKGCCAEHWPDADPALMLIVTLEVAAEAFRLTVAVPVEAVLTLAFALVCARPNVFYCKHWQEKCHIIMSSNSML